MINSTAVNVLIVEDDAEDFEIARDMLTRATRSSFSVHWARHYAEGLAAAVGGTHDICLVDYNLHGESGIDLVREAEYLGAQAPMVLLTGSTSHALVEEAGLAGVDDFVSKSALTSELLERTIRYAIDRRKAHAHLRESEAKYRLLFDANPIPTWVVAAADQSIIAVNDAAVADYGYSREEFTKLRMRDIETVTDLPALLCTTAFELPDSLPLRHRRRNGSLMDVEVSMQEVTFEGRRACIILARDITDSLRAHAALRESEERFRELARSIGVAFFVIDPATNQALYLSPAFEQVFDRSVAEALARPRAWLEGVHPDDRDRLLASLAIEQAGELEFRILRRDGTMRWARRHAQAVRAADGTVQRIVGTIEDITELRRAQQQAEANSKMEAVGRLAGGVAHDFNNILTAIIGEADLLKLEIAGNDAATATVEKVLSSGMRAADLTRQLLAFSRQQMFQLRVLDLNTVVTSIDGMLRRLLGEDVDLSVNPGEGLGAISGDPSQIDQIILNLAVNARDAMPSGGRLTIATTNIDVSESVAAGHEGMRPGSYVALVVSDEGTGMSDDVRARIFEPFYTTKERGHGTGLGLATVYGIVRQSNGGIMVASKPGGGTTFTVCFPRVSGPVDVSEVPAAPPVNAAGSETVLIIEDEDGVRAIVSRVLERKGYTVLHARDGVEAIAVSEACEGPIHLVLSDIVMPKMMGPEAVQALRQKRPGVKVIFMSGYTDRAIVQSQRARDPHAFLQKPFTPAALLQHVRGALDAT